MFIKKYQFELNVYTVCHVTTPPPSIPKLKKGDLYPSNDKTINLEDSALQELDMGVIH